MAARSIKNTDQLNLGQVSYNNFLFPPAINSSAQMTPVYDRADRSLMYVKYSIRIEFLLYSRDADSLGHNPSATHSLGGQPGDNWVGGGVQDWDPNMERGLYKSAGQGVAEPFGGPTGLTQTEQGGIDHQMHMLRRTLCQPGRELIITGIGLGPDLDINPESLSGVTGVGRATHRAGVSAAGHTHKGLFDVVWGPKPREISWEPVGSSGAARVVWEVEVGLVECEEIQAHHKERMPVFAGAIEQAGTLPIEILQITYNQNWNIDPTGATEKNYEAIIQIRGYVDPSDLRRVLVSADEYRLMFEPPMTEGYIRTRRYSLNDDKTTLTIQIADKEHPTDWPLPPGCSNADVNYSINSSLLGTTAVGGPAGFRIWDANLSGTITLTKGWHPFYRSIYPYYLFLLIIRSRFRPGYEDVKAGDRRGIDTALFGANGSDAKPLEAENIPTMQIPLSFELNEKVFGREFGFAFSWVAVMSKPEKAMGYLRYGGPPNVFAEDHKVPGLDPWHGDTMAGLVNWNWTNWVQSMIDPLGSGASNPNPTNFRFYLSIPGPTPKSKRKVVLTLLHAWSIKEPPMSIYGADNARFEGDNRMEPCMSNQDFWYTVNEQGFSESVDPKEPMFTDTTDDNSNKILHMSSDVELIENSQVVTASPLNIIDDPSTLIKYVDGESGEGTWGSTKVESGLQTGKVSKPGQNHVGDTDMSYDQCEWEYDAASDKAPSVQSLGAPSYQLHVYGYASCIGKPLNPPRVAEYGKAKAVKTARCRTAVDQIVRGLQEVWVTKWDLWYDLLGTPNGVPRPKGSYTPDTPGSTNLPSPIHAEGQTSHGATRRGG